MAIGTVTLAWRIVDPFTLAPGIGSVRVRVPLPLRATTDHLLIGSDLPSDWIPLDVTGSGSIVIPDPHDPGVSPQGWPPHVEISSDVLTEKFVVVIPPGSAGTTIHLDTKAPVEPVPAVNDYALVSTLNDYVPKTGARITGPILWDGPPTDDDHLVTKAYADSLSGGGGSTPDATTLIKGKLRLTGDLGGSADAPTVPALAGKANTSHTHATGDVTGLAAYVDGRAATAVAAVVNAAPSTLDTLAELATALGGDPAFATTTTALIGTKATTASVTTLAGRVDVVEAALPGKIPVALIDAAGDLIIGSAADTAVRLPKGTDGQLLGVATGTVGWVDAPAGGPSSTPPPVHGPGGAPAEIDGFVCWTGDPLHWSTLSTIGDGNTSWVRLPVPAGQTIEKLWVCVGTAGSYAASSGKPNRMALADDNGNVLSLTPDDPTLYTVQGWRSGTLAAPQAAQSTPRWVYVGLIVGDMSGLQLRYPTNASLFGGTTETNTINGGPETRRRAMYANGLSALPATFTPSSYGTVTAYMPLLALTGTGAAGTAPNGVATLDQTAVRYGCKALTVDPHDLSWSTPQYIEMFDQRHYQFWVPLPIGELVTGVRLPIQLHGAGAGGVHFAIYQDDNTLLGETGDVAPTLLGAGVDGTWQNFPLTAPAATTGPGVWLTALSTLTTGPKLAFCNTNGAADLPGWLLNPSSHKTAVRREGVTVVPSTITPSTATDYIDVIIGAY